MQNEGSHFKLLRFQRFTNFGLQLYYYYNDDILVSKKLRWVCYMRLLLLICFLTHLDFQPEEKKLH